MSGSSTSLATEVGLRAQLPTPCSWRSRTETALKPTKRTSFSSILKRTVGDWAKANQLKPRVVD